MSISDSSHVLAATGGQTSAPVSFSGQLGLRRAQEAAERVGHWVGREVTAIRDFAADPRVQSIGKAFLMAAPFIVANFLLPLWAKIGIGIGVAILSQKYPAALDGLHNGIGLTALATGCLNVFSGAVTGQIKPLVLGAVHIGAAALLFRNTILLQNIRSVTQPVWEKLCHIRDRVYEKAVWLDRKVHDLTFGHLPKPIATVAEIAINSLPFLPIFAFAPIRVSIMAGLLALPFTTENQQLSILNAAGLAMALHGGLALAGHQALGRLRKVANGELLLLGSAVVTTIHIYCYTDYVIREDYARAGRLHVDAVTSLLNEAPRDGSTTGSAAVPATLNPEQN